MGEELNTLSLEEGTLYYIDGQPCEGIKEDEFELEALEPEELSDGPVLHRPAIADSMELELTLTPESAKAIVEAFKPAFDEQVRLLKAIREWAGNAIREVAAAVRHCMDNLLYAANDHPKWWHYYKHAKKARTRKKYRRLLIKQLHEKLANGGNLTQEETA